MYKEYCSIRWLDENTAVRRTAEVDLKCEVIKGGKFQKTKDSPILDGYTIKLTGTSDLEHHIVEDATILLKKMVQVKCGPHQSLE